MTQARGNYDTVRLEGWGIGRFVEGQQGICEGSVGDAARRRVYESIRLNCAIIRSGRAKT